jgi:hypothetical protein
VQLGLYLAAVFDDPGFRQRSISEKVLGSSAATTLASLLVIAFRMARIW